MKIMTFNANGIRAAARKGFFEWFATQDIDVLCIQETKAQIDQLDDDVFNPEGYERILFDAQKKGYSGTAIYTKHKPLDVRIGLGFDICDDEGRYIEIDLENKVTVATLYLPSGSSSDERQARKMLFLEKFTPYLKEVSESDRHYIICGDWNICHKEIDLKNWKGNKKNSGFLPEEREWLDHIYDDIGLVDAFRIVKPEADLYTWWSNRGQARANNVGWRIDYQVTSKSLADKVKDASIYKENWYSDHAPLTMIYDI